MSKASLPLSIVFALFALLLNFELCSGQIIIGDTYLNVFASTYVKSLEEFSQRFNAQEFHPDIDTLNKDNLRLRSILSLFDSQSFQVRDSVIASRLVAFAEDVCINGYFVDTESVGLYAEASCLFSFNNQEIPINIVFVFENVREDINKWAVVGVNGLVECGLLDTDRSGYINPTQHELRFTDLSIASQNLTNYISAYKTVDQLSYLLGLLKAKQLEFIVCNKVRFHFLQIPGYVFVVDEINRLGNNAGYLITALMQTENSKKNEYISIILGSEELKQ